MKKCLICGTIDESGSEPTCPQCGEASWSDKTERVTIPEKPKPRSSK